MPEDTSPRQLSKSHLASWQPTTETDEQGDWCNPDLVIDRFLARDEGKRVVSQRLKEFFKLAAIMLTTRMPMIELFIMRLGKPSCLYLRSINKWLC